MNIQIQTETGLHRPTRRLRWWNTLAFRLGAVLNVVVIIVLSVSAWLDHRRDADTLIGHTYDDLREQAHVLRAAWNQFSDPQSFQRFLDGFCQQMSTSASPGHHIALFDVAGAVLARAHERASSELESQMRPISISSERTFVHRGEEYGVYSVQLDDGSRIVVTVSLKPVLELLRTQGVRRAVATGVLMLFLFGMTAACLFVWVRNPMRRFVSAVSAVSKRRFDHRVAERGAAEFCFLAEGVNDMIQTLGRTERQRTSEMQRVRDIQRALIGETSSSINGCQIEAVFLPTATVGGDYFDTVPLQDGSVVVAVIDVTGHGVPGALCTALLRSSLRNSARTSNDVGEILSRLNRDLCDISAAGVFATAALLKIHNETGLVEYANAGHDAPLLIAPDCSVMLLDQSSLLLGVDPDVEYGVAQANTMPGGKLFVFTDGLHEAMSAQGEQFGRDRVADSLIKSNDQQLRGQLQAALDEVTTFQGESSFEDDLTLLGIQWSDIPVTALSSK